MTYPPFQKGDTKSVPFNRREITSREIFLQCGSGFRVLRIYAGFRNGQTNRSEAPRSSSSGNSHADQTSLRGVPPCGF